MTTLEDILKQAGQESICLEDKVLVLPFGGRILGLYPAPDCNALWVSPDLASAESARALIAGEGWLNLGGQRIWISPEVETNITDPKRLWDTYEVPKAMDPGAYEVMERADHSVTIASPMTLRFHRHDCDVSLHVKRTVAVLADPPVDLPAGVSFAGYVQTSTLSGVDVGEGCRPGLWNIIQVSGGGQIVIPVAADADPRALIAKPVFEREADRIRCTVATDESFKFSLRADDSRGRMACLNTTGLSPALVVCRFPVLDPSRYADVPADDLEDTGHMQQVYVDDGNLGGFGEMEYHAPALAPGKSVTDRGEVWAFAGPAHVLEDLLEKILLS